MNILQSLVILSLCILLSAAFPPLDSSATEEQEQIEEGDEILPRIVVEDENGAPLFFYGGRFWLLKSARDSQDKIVLACRAPYPVKFVYPLELQSNNSRPKFESDKHVVLYTDFYDRSTYSFLLKVTFSFGYVPDHFRFTCTSTEKPGNRSMTRMVDYNWGVQEHNQGFWLTFSIPTPDQEEQPNSNNMTIASRSNAANKSECDAYFYSRQIVDPLDGAPTYTFTCQLSDGRPGYLTSGWFYWYCRSKARCDFLLEHQPVNNCWKEYVRGVTCKKCAWAVGPSYRIFSFANFISTCKAFPSNDEAASPLSETPDDPSGQSESSVSGFFGVPQSFGSIPKLFYSQEEILKEEMLAMREFYEENLIGTLLKVRCTASSYYFASTFQFALQYEGRIDLELLPVSQEIVWDHTLEALSQTREIKLVDTRLNRIFCFVAIQNSYDWMNASRPVTVVGLRDFYNTNEACKPEKLLGSNSQEEDDKQVTPSMTFTPSSDDSFAVAGRAHTFSPAKPNMVVDGSAFSTVGTVQILMTCEAPYPVRIRYLYNGSPYDDISKPQAMGWASMRSVNNLTDFWNNSTYVFSLYEQVFFQSVPDKHIFRCESVAMPCLHQAIQYSHGLDGLTQLNFTLLLPSAVTPSREGPETETTEVITAGKNKTEEEEDDCEFYIYYEKKERGYEFRCGAWFENTWKVQLRTCESTLDCHNVFQHQRQPKKCWKPYNPQGPCVVCHTFPLQGLRPFVATCLKSSSGRIWDEGVSESTRGSFAFFDVSSEGGEISAIHFGDDELENSTMISMSNFAEFQLLGETLKVTCTGSKYGCAGPIHIALERGPGSQLDFLQNCSEDASEDSHSRSATQSLTLNEESLTGIYCFCGNVSSFDWLNTSRPIQVHAGQSPSIEITAGPRDEGHHHTLSNNETSVNFLLNDKDMEITCRGTGYPPPLITWTSTAKEAPKPIEVPGQNKNGYVEKMSRISFPTVFANFAGTYTCSVTNSLGTVTRSVTLLVHDQERIKEKIRLAVIITLFIAAFGVACLVAGKYIRKLKRERNLTAVEVARFLNGRVYFDPAVPNDDIYSRPYSEKLEILREDIKIDETKPIGGGQFCDVLLGELLGKPEGGSTTVAIKTPKSSISAESFLSLLDEIKIMEHLQGHPNIVRLIGACTYGIKRRRVLVILEYCHKGDLLSFLKKHRAQYRSIWQLTSDSEEEISETESEAGLIKEAPPHLIKFCKRRGAGYEPLQPFFMNEIDLLDVAAEIARGMSYLTQKNVVHGDLAARNILLTENFEVKIGDFGLSKQLLNRQYFRTDQEFLPWRWMSWESLVHQKFSIKSDVWSFGVTLYEIFSLGSTPFKHIVSYSSRFLKDLEGGYRMDPPRSDTIEEIYNLMLQCWQKKMIERPSFDGILDTIAEIRRGLCDDGEDSSQADEDHDNFEKEQQQ